MRNRILIVDDDIVIGISLKKLLKEYKTKFVDNGYKALEVLESFKPQIILLDFGLPDINGFEVLKKIKSYDNKIKVIMITSFADVKKTVQAMKLGAYDFFAKPFDKFEILRVVEDIFSFSSHSEFISENITNSMGESDVLKKVLSNVKRVAKTDITVFLEGETGTGKELFARMIHKLSNRREHPFITVDCGAIPDSLFESELFGHKRGAFTGAISDKKGKFLLANHGTLFLDEINSLPLNLQPKFLRVLQEGELQRLGDEKTQKIDVRIIAASNNNINEDVRKGIFREDLFYRINEFKINLPTLSERKEDIMIIAKYFLNEISEKYHKRVIDFSKEAKNALENYSWPGNIRELKNVIKSAVLLCDADIIEKEHLILSNIRKNIEYEEDTFDDFEDNISKIILKRALEKTKYNKTETAKLLKISRSKLYNLLKRYNLD